MWENKIYMVYKQNTCDWSFPYHEKSKLLHPLLFFLMTQDTPETISLKAAYIVTLKIIWYGY